MIRGLRVYTDTLGLTHFLHFDFKVFCVFEGYFIRAGECAGLRYETEPILLPFPLLLFERLPIDVFSFVLDLLLEYLALFLGSLYVLFPFLQPLQFHVPTYYQFKLLLLHLCRLAFKHVFPEERSKEEP